MRDPHRIPEILDLLGQIWVKYPDLRLGQIVSVAKDWSNSNNANTDVFYIEDSEVIVGLRKILENDE